MANTTVLKNSSEWPADNRFRYALGLILVGSVALLLREWFVLVTSVEAPIRGDIVQYVAYGWNLVEHGTFSHAAASHVVPIPDAYRGPGYPLFLALTFALAGDDGFWYPLVLQLQAVLAALTCVLTVACARQWLSRAWSLVPGIALALWPHHIAATGALLSEIVLGFCLILAVWLNALALTKPSRAAAFGAGFAYAYAYLVNPLALPLAFLAGAVTWLSGRRAAAVVVVALPLTFLLGWQIRNTISVDAANSLPNRGLVNLVQGSWPLYHAAYNARNDHEIPAAIMRAIAAEERLIVTDLGAGLSAMGARMADSPLDYARWYLLEKPWLLWDWDIRIGIGDIYYHRVTGSPLETQGGLRAIKRVSKALNPALFGLSVATTVAMMLAWIRRRRVPDPAPLLIAVGFAYFTAIHVVFQAEPRYSIPYRSFEMLAAVTAITWFIGSLARQFSRGAMPDPTPDRTAAHVQHPMSIHHSAQPLCEQR